MRLQLEKIKFKNFMSFGNQWTEIDLDKDKTTLVVGKNGGGKSSAILDTISFALFNKPFRNINKPQLCNSITQKECLVDLEFKANGHQFRVVRGIKPVVFEIYKDGALLTQSSDHRDYQQVFEKYILKVNHKTFCQIVMLGSAIFKPFMSLPAHERRAIIEDLLDLKIFSVMNVKLKDRISTCESDIYYKNQERGRLEERIALTEKHIKELQTSNEELIKEKKAQIDDLTKKIGDFTKKKEDLNQVIDNLLIESDKEQKGIRNYDEMHKLSHQLEHKIQQLNKDMEFLNNAETCPTCTQVIEETFKKKTIEEKSLHQDEVNKALKKLTNRVEKTQVIMKKIVDLGNQISEHKATIRQWDTNLRFYTRNLRDLNIEIEKIESKNEKIDTSELEQWHTNLSTVKSAVVEAEDDRTVMGYAMNMLKDNGIKSKIIKIYIPVINQLIQKYLAALDFFVEFKLNEEFDETIASRFRDEFSYESFSEGEKARLNLAILFSWRAIAKLRGSIDCNLVILDEIFDGSLDHTGTDDLLKLINNLTSNENIIMISHKEDQISEKFSRVLKFEKNKNFSQLVEPQ